jgi:hypothetical protein
MIIATCPNYSTTRKNMRAGRASCRSADGGTRAIGIILSAATIDKLGNTRSSQAKRESP